MATIDFPLTIPELTKMRQDGDKISLFFSYASSICIVLFFIFLSLSYLLSCETFKILSFISLPLAAVFLLIVYIYPYFLLDKTRKFEEIDKLWGMKKLEALHKLTSDERKEYESYLTEKTVQDFHRIKK